MQKMLKRVTVLLLVSLVGIGVGCRRSDGSSGGRTVIQNKGSDTLVNVAQAWAEEYKEFNPDVAVAVTGQYTWVNSISLSMMVFILETSSTRIAIMATEISGVLWGSTSPAIFNMSFLTSAFIRD